MPIERGQVVLGLAGRDRGNYLCVVGSTDATVTVADGKQRKLGHPKTKNVRHIGATDKVLSADAMATDRGLRRALSALASTDL